MISSKPKFRAPRPVGKNKKICEVAKPDAASRSEAAAPRPPVPVNKKRKVCEAPEDVTCSLCMDTIGEGANVYDFSCTHKFHVECIGPWLVDHSTCPNCRACTDSSLLPVKEFSIQL